MPRLAHGRASRRAHRLLDLHLSREQGEARSSRGGSRDRPALLAQRVPAAGARMSEAASSEAPAPARRTAAAANAALLLAFGGLDLGKGLYFLRHYPQAAPFDI